MPDRQLHAFMPGMGEPSEEDMAPFLEMFMNNPQNVAQVEELEAKKNQEELDALYARNPNAGIQARMGQDLMKAAEVGFEPAFDTPDEPEFYANAPAEIREQAPAAYEDLRSRHPVLTGAGQLGTEFMGDFTSPGGLALEALPVVGSGAAVAKGASALARKLGILK